MNDHNTPDEEFTRFYRLTKTGRWQRKSQVGFYEEIKNKALKQLQILAAKSAKRNE